ncbi:MAG: hypothetical protein HOV94_15815 [Saccharothrix sp.]|nr:hypothetical protein [Saccharothrix sp.]
MIAAAAIGDGETAWERQMLVTRVSSVALHGVLRKLVDGVPALEAIAALETEEVDAAREAAVAYRGTC